MTKIKLCGLSRDCDIDYVNHARPDFCGFIIDVPKSRRNVSPERARELRQRLAPEILPVGVFVDAAPERIAELCEDGTLGMVQLHGHEDEHYIRALRRRISVPVIQAFRVETAADVKRAVDSSADHILLDHGAGGTGQRFDWSLVEGVERPFLLAGGLTPENLAEAILQVRPWGVDLSSGVETDGWKDKGKMRAAVDAVRRIG